MKVTSVVRSSNRRIVCLQCLVRKRILEKSSNVASSVGTLARLSIDGVTKVTLHSESLDEFGLELFLGHNQLRWTV